MGTNFWDRNAGRYDRFMEKDRVAYEQMYGLISPVVRHKTVLELATGTGLIAKHILREADRIEATDASPEMIAAARQGNCSAKLHFSVEDLFCLPYGEDSFDVVIAANVLHVIPEPERALREMGRALKGGGTLIVPTFTHGDNTLPGKIKALFMRAAGFPLHSRWTGPEYLAFLETNGWRVRRNETLPASFPLTYAECVKGEEV